MKRLIQLITGILLWSVLFSSVQAGLITVPAGDNQALIDAIIAGNNDPELTGIVIDPGPGGGNNIYFY